jgi:hypothetical protein
VWLLSAHGARGVSAACGLVYAAVLALWLACVGRFETQGPAGAEERKEK